MTPIEPTSPTLTIEDDQNVAIGLVLAGPNPNSLTIVSAAWSVLDASGTADPNAVVSTDTLTVQYTAVTGDDTTVSLSAEVTMSDGSVLSTLTLPDGTTGPAATLVVGAVPGILTVSIVFGTPAPNSGGSA